MHMYINVYMHMHHAYDIYHVHVHVRACMRICVYAACVLLRTCTRTCACTYTRHVHVRARMYVYACVYRLPRRICIYCTNCMLHRTDIDLMHMEACAADLVKVDAHEGRACASTGPATGVLQLAMALSLSFARSMTRTDCMHAKHIK